MIFPTDAQGQAHYRSVTQHKVTSHPGGRDAKILLALLAQFDVEHHERYAKRGGLTRCNTFAQDVIEAAGIVAPRHWVDPVSGEPVQPGRGAELNANRLFDWFARHGSNYGWRKADAQAARLYALAGKIAVAIWRNPKADAQGNGESGHVSIIAPDAAPDLYCATAGKFNYQHAKLVRSFGNITPAFWVHE